MAKKLTTFILILAGSFLFAASTAFAQAAPGTSTPSILEDAQTAIDNLISAKDTGNANDVSLRIAALNQVLALQESETKDYELKLINVGKDKAYDGWKAAALSTLSQFLSYYDAESQLLSTSTALTESDVKQIATDFKTWRDAEYLPLIGAIQDFLLVKQEASAVQVAQTRYGKIVSDLGGLGIPAISNSKDIKISLNDASSSIVAADKLNRQAAVLFLSLYVNATSTQGASSTSAALAASSTASSSVSLNMAPLNLTATSSADNSASTTATSTGADATSTATSTPAVVSNPISIKGLIKASLVNIRGAYQDFIDISNLVRQLLSK
jgi:hypothetical protein